VRDHESVEIIIRGHNLPGRSFCSEGEPLDNVHVGVQVRRDPVDLVAGDAPAADWRVDVRVETTEGQLDFKGPAVHGPRGQRFLYLTWGDVGADGNFTMFRRAKLMLDRIDPGMVREALTGQRPLQATIDLTDGRGCPRCARVDEPALSWTVS
jgi:hypothetical protein